MLKSVQLDINFIDFVSLLNIANNAHNCHIDGNSERYEKANGASWLWHHEKCIDNGV